MSQDKLTPPTPKSKEELREQIRAALKREIYQFQYHARLINNLMQLFTSYHQQQLEQAVREARIDEVENCGWSAATESYPAYAERRIAELQSTKEGKSNE